MADLLPIEIGNVNAPHRNIITIQVETHELMPNGQCRGVIVYKDRKTLILDGQDKHIAIRKLNELLQEIQNKCQNQ